MSEHGHKCDPAEDAKKMIETLDQMYHEKPVGFMAFLLLQMTRRHGMHGRPMMPPPFCPPGPPPPPPHEHRE